MRSQSGAGPSRGAAKPRQVCPHYHGAVELIGRRWAGAILYALTRGSLHFAELKEVLKANPHSETARKLLESLRTIRERKL